MLPEDKYHYWTMLSDYDIETAAVLVEGKRWVYVTFTCEQAVERLLKGMYVYYSGKEAPKSHNINFLLSKVEKFDLFIAKVDRHEYLDAKSKYEDFFTDLIFYYMSDYPFSYKKIMDRFVDEKVAVEIYQKTLEVLKWLKSLQKIKKPIDIIN